MKSTFLDHFRFLVKMTQRYAFVVNGQILIIDRDENEKELRFSLRLRFITRRHEFFSVQLLTDMSRLYADKVLLGLKYPQRQEELLDSILATDNAELSEPEEEDFETFEAEVKGKVIEEATENIIKFDDGTHLTPFNRDGAFFKSSAGDLSNLMDAEVTDVGLMKASLTSTKAGVILEVDNGVEEGGSIVQSCADVACSQGAGVQLVQEDEPDIVIVTQKPAEEETMVYQLTFKRADAINGFMAPDYQSDFTLPDKEHLFHSIVQCLGWKKASFVAGNTDPETFLDNQKALNTSEMVRLYNNLKLPADGSSDEAWDAMLNDELLQCVRAFYATNPDLAAKLIGTGNSRLVYDNQDDDTLGNELGLGPSSRKDGRSANVLGNALMTLRSEIATAPPPVAKPVKTKAKSAKLSLETCDKLLDEGIEQSLIDMFRLEIHEEVESADQTLFERQTLQIILNAYDDRYFENELQALIAGGKVKVELAWVSDLEPDVPADLTQDGANFSLKLSQPFISSLFTSNDPVGIITGQMHNVNGVNASDQIYVVQLFLEQLFIELASYLCKAGKIEDAERLATNMFGQKAFGTASFVPAAQAKALSATEIRERLNDALNRQSITDENPKVTLADGRTATLRSAKSSTEAMIVAESAALQERVPYADIVMLDGKQLV